MHDMLLGKQGVRGSSEELHAIRFRLSGLPLPQIVKDLTLAADNPRPTRL